jgi:hypothetical protein
VGTGVNGVEGTESVPSAFCIDARFLRVVCLEGAEDELETVLFVDFVEEFRETK